jgi:prophage antirepressor-like protein
LSIRDFQFQGNHIRTVGTDRDLWFVARDVCSALGISWGGDTLDNIPKEWRAMRKLRIPQVNQYGQQGFTEVEVVVINEAAVYKLAFRSQKPAADAFTNWVASEVLPSIRVTGGYRAERTARYERLGKSHEWIEQRVEGIDARKDFTNVLDAHDVKSVGYAKCTDAIYRPVIGYSAKGAKIARGLLPKANLRDNLSTIELAAVKFTELLAAARIERENIRGNEPCEQACRVSGQAVAQAAIDAGKKPLK